MSEPKSVGDVIRAASRSNGETAQRGRIAESLPAATYADAIAQNIASGRAARNQPVAPIDFLRAETIANNAASADAAKGAKSAEKAAKAIMADLAVLFGRSER